MPSKAFRFPDNAQTLDCTGAASSHVFTSVLIYPSLAILIASRLWPGNVQWSYLEYSGSLYVIGAMMLKEARKIIGPTKAWCMEL